MQTYEIPLVPGPTSVPEPVRRAYLTDYGSGDLEPEFFELYERTQDQLRQILKTQNQIAIMTGEGMLALWAAVKSCLQPGDVVVSVATGPFGVGIGQLAASVGATVYTIDFAWDEVASVEAVEAAIMEYKPKMVTVVHCETPCGTLNPVGAIGQMVARYGVPLYYVDAVASVAGAPVEVDAWHIDLCLIGSQKALSVPPDLAIVSVSERAWSIIESVDYQGYDALKPFRTALANRWFPYTPSWHSLAALHVACQLVLDEGLDRVIQRHANVARYCRQRIRAMGLELFPRDESFCSPTVTAVKIPEGLSWEELDRRLRARGVVVAPSYEKLAGRIFRIGHMGSQADMKLVQQGLDVLAEVL